MVWHFLYAEEFIFHTAANFSVLAAPLYEIKYSSSNSNEQMRSLRNSIGFEFRFRSTYRSSNETGSNRSYSYRTWHAICLRADKASPVNTYYSQDRRTCPRKCVGTGLVSQMLVDVAIDVASGLNWDLLSSCGIVPERIICSWTFHAILHSRKTYFTVLIFDRFICSKNLQKFH